MPRPVPPHRDTVEHAGTDREDGRAAGIVRRMRVPRTRDVRRATLRLRPMTCPHPRSPHPGAAWPAKHGTYCRGCKNTIGVGTTISHNPWGPGFIHPACNGALMQRHESQTAAEASEAIDRTRMEVLSQ